MDNRNEEIEALIALLKAMPGEGAQNMRAIMAQSYIQQNGPIPDKYGDEFKAALAGNSENLERKGYHE